MSDTAAKKRGRPPTKKETIEAAVALLEGLLRSPKTRNGLIAAVAPKLSRNFVFGWLSDQIRTGKVTTLKTFEPVRYQMTEFVVIEQPAQSDFPSWLYPCSVPASTQRHVYIDGKLAHHFRSQGEQEQCG